MKTRSVSKKKTGIKILTMSLAVVISFVSSIILFVTPAEASTSQTLREFTPPDSWANDDTNFLMENELPGFTESTLNAVKALENSSTIPTDYIMFIYKFDGTRCYYATFENRIYSDPISEPYTIARHNLLYRDFNQGLRYYYFATTANNPDPVQPKVNSESGIKDNTPSHTHSYSWVVTKSPTATEDGEEAYMCSCGAVAQTRTLSSFSTFEDEIVGQIKNAPTNGVVTIDMKTWNSLGKAVRDALVARPDVTLKLSFRSEGYKGQRLKVTIPTGIDRYVLWDENGWLGLCRLGSTLGYDQ